MQGEAESVSARGLAEASADLLQSLDHLLESLESSAEPHNSDSPTLGADPSQGNPPHHPQSQADTAAAGRLGSAKLINDGRAEADIIGQQQHAPKVQDFAGRHC